MHPLNPVAIRPERVEELSQEIGHILLHDLDSIRQLNMTTRLLSLNARIEAARAGASGATFAVVANEVMNLAKSMDASFQSIESRTSPLLQELGTVGSSLARDVRGKRLADLAATHLDLVDRNLYERSCDVRWWATDRGLVQAAMNPAGPEVAFASKRMGTILDSYTVYYDLLLCDRQGQVLANGRPGQYQAANRNASQTEWFRKAMATRSGSEFGFAGLHTSEFTGGARVLVYSAAIRKDGEEHGEIVGVLGVVFRWDALGQTIVDSAALAPDEKERSQVMLADERGSLLASSGPAFFTRNIPLTNWTNQSSESRFHFLFDDQGHPTLVAVARSQGYETYATGWYSVILQRMS